MRSRYIVLSAITLLFSCASSKLPNKNIETKEMIIRISEQRKKVIDYLSQQRWADADKDRQAYEAHLKTPHFQKYKTTTLKMVKALRLIDMNAIDPQTMPEVFSKMGQKR